MTDTTQKVAPRGVTDPDDFPSFPENLRRLPQTDVSAPSIAVDEDDVFNDCTITPSLTDADGGIDGEHFHRVKAASTALREPDADAEAVDAAERVAENLRGSNEYIIRAGEEIVGAKIRFGEDPALYEAFIAALVVKNVLTKHDGRLKEESPKLSKLHSIGQHADILRRPQIFERLPEGYTGLYAAIGLLKALPGDETARVEGLQEVLTEGERRQEISRQFFIDQTKTAKQKLKPPSPSLTADPPETGADIILITPSRRDIRRLNKDVTEDSLPACRRISELAAEVSNAVVVVPVSAMALVKARIIDECGFVVERVLLLSKPDAADITEAEVAVVAARGAGQHAIGSYEWSLGSEVLDPRDLAERLFPHAANKVHVFAEMSEGDWTALVGDDNWRSRND